MIYGDRPVLMWSDEQGRIVPHLHVWINRKKNKEEWVDIAKLPFDCPFMVEFELSYRHMFNLFFCDRKKHRDWLYKNYLNIIMKKTDKRTDNLGRPKTKDRYKVNLHIDTDLQPYLRVQENQSNLVNSLLRKHFKLGRDA